MKNKNDILAIKEAISKLHESEARWLESVPVKEIFEGNIVWEGIVEVFELTDHPIAKKCYAWSHEIEGSTKRKFYAVLHQGPVDSPENAVKASIVADQKRRIIHDGKTKSLYFY